MNRALDVAELEAVAGGVATAGNAAASQTTSQETTGGSPDFGRGYGRGWCYWDPYVCRR